jgi:hypothetical protein
METTKEGFMPRTAKRKDAQTDPAEERRQLDEDVDNMLVPDSEQLRANVHWLKRHVTPASVQQVMEVLVERAFMEDSGRATDALGFFGADAYPVILRAFCNITDADRRPRLVRLLERLGAEVSPSEYSELGMLFASLCMALKGEQLVCLISAQRAMRASFENDQRKRPQPV